MAKRNDPRMALTAAAGVEWILTEPVIVREIIDAPDYGLATRVLVRSEKDAGGSYRECELWYADGELRFNNSRIEVNDDLMAYLAIMDAAGAAYGGTWVCSEPYPDES